MAAKKKPVETWSLADLEIPADSVGGAAAWTEVTEVTERPARSAGTIVTDEDGSGAARLVEFLSTNKFL
jgi:electron transfer flavoprotein beta subunit